MSRVLDSFEMVHSLMQIAHWLPSPDTLQGLLPQKQTVGIFWIDVGVKDGPVLHGFEVSCVPIIAIPRRQNAVKAPGGRSCAVAMKSM